MPEHVNDAFKNRVGNERISDRQVDELIGIARGIAADGIINSAEVKFLEKWLAANISISNQPIIRTLYKRVQEILEDGIVGTSECAEFLETLGRFSDRDFELGEPLKSTTLPLCNPAPTLRFFGASYCFTGTFLFGKRKECENAVIMRGAVAGPLSLRTNFLVIGVYATESWKHSSFGAKIMKATTLRNNGHAINIISEKHWSSQIIDT